MGEQKLGVVAWGNGGCSADGASAGFPLLELASHGYLVIASGHILSGPGCAAQARHRFASAPHRFSPRVHRSRANPELESRRAWRRLQSP
jgi:hypothetical protein